MADNLQDCLSLLAENDNRIRDSAIRVLLEICDNIIKYPGELKYRKIRIANPAISNKLLSASGAIECLFAIGFIEDDEYFTLPAAISSTSRLQEFQKLLNELQKKEQMEIAPMKSCSTGARAKEHPLPIFFQTITQTFRDVLRYEDVECQKAAKAVVPIERLQLEAMKKMREFQRDYKLKSTSDNNNADGTEELLFDNLMLAELVNWFKNEFFTWVNSPMCTRCTVQCEFYRSEFKNDPTVSRIEIHKCTICGNEERFPRYVDPKILLKTRKGRCGEWANAFTLICRSFGMDARIVYDKTDHVWTEIWSITAQRWIHVDPCENAIDRPLLYEKGWNKKLTYIIAYSRDEIQDVTWRYTRNQSAVMARRNDCTEQSLVDLIGRLNEERQSSSGYSVARRKFVIKRRLMELADFLPAPPGQKKLSDNDDNEYGGRISGDAAWRLGRGEISQVNQSHVWKVPKGIRNYQLKYFIIKDIYEVRDENGKILEIRNNWSDGVDQCDGGVFRNIENDWKMIYLARSSSSAIARVTWSVEITDDKVSVESLEFKATIATFNGAAVEWKLESFNNDTSTLTLPIMNCKCFKTSELKNARKISITANLSGGSGDVAWQHAQLFRQAFNDNECSMLISIVMKTE